MRLRFEPVTETNRAQAEALGVLPEQTDFIESVAECMKEADELKVWRPVGIYDGGNMVGFAMYGCFEEEGQNGRVWLDRLLIDRRYQGKGYGAAALEGLLERLRGEYGKKEIYLSVYENNSVAIALYSKAGFRFNGEADTKGEKVMSLIR